MIEVRQLSRSWGRFALTDVSLRVDAGEYFVVLGPCGSGKTLLLESIAGLHDPDSGSIHINGRDVTGLPPERRRVGLVYQQCALFPHLSVAANVAYGLRYGGLSRRECRDRVAEVTELLGIGDLIDRRDPTELSGGEAQKVALARALAIKPHVLLLDEPMSSLDKRTRERVIEVLRSIDKTLGVPVIHVTHDYTEAAALADRVAVFNEGRAVQMGTLGDVFQHPRTPCVADFLGRANPV